MARITVEDCISVIPNQFDLIVVAARRARDLSAGESPLVSRDNDKNTIVALREIAAGALTPADLQARAVAAISVGATRPGSEVIDLQGIEDMSDVVITEDDGDEGEGE